MLETPIEIFLSSFGTSDCGKVGAKWLERNKPRQEE